MTELADSVSTIFAEFYYWVTIVMMFLIHVGFATYEVGAGRRKNLQHILIKNVMVIPVVTVTFFFFGGTGPAPRAVARRTGRTGYDDI